VGICGTDIELYDGTMFYITSGMTSLPLTPGHEWSGEVVEVGDEVAEFQVGDRVVGECSVGCGNCPTCLRGWYNQCPSRTETGILGRDGGFAEYLTFPEAFLHKCNELEYEQSAFIEPTGVALAATKLAQISPDDVAAVVGDGPIGLFAAQTVKAYGARKVILLGAIDSRLEVGRQLGVDAVINVKTENVVERVKEVTDGHMIDAFVEAVGHPSGWDVIASTFAPRARIAMTGLTGGKPYALDFDPLVVGNVTIFGSLGGPSVWDEAIDLHRRGLVTARPLITHNLPLDSFVEGIEILRTRRDNAIKIVLNP
jgi:threonine dehydrogenase-like Zn-dependent dehydrogenase